MTTLMRSPLAALAAALSALAAPAALPVVTAPAALAVVAFSVPAAGASPVSVAPGLKKVHDPRHVTGTIQ